MLQPCWRACATPLICLTPQTATLGGGPGTYWATTDGRFTWGDFADFQHFCATCNRVRPVGGWHLVYVFGSRSVALRPLLRAGISDTELENVIRDAIELQTERHGVSRTTRQGGCASWPRRGLTNKAANNPSWRVARTLPY